jgi:hypothetical protein
MVVLRVPGGKVAGEIRSVLFIFVSLGRINKIPIKKEVRPA